VLPLLPLLLVGIASGEEGGTGGGLDGALEAGQAAEEGIVGELLVQGADDIEDADLLAQHGVGMLDVGGGEGLDSILEGCEAGDDLWMVSWREEEDRGGE
jgi:hypothetical protein